MNKPKQVFSIRIDPEILRRIRRLARKERTTIGTIVRESLDGFLEPKEEKMEMENEWEIRAVALLSRLPSDEEEAEAVLDGGRDPDSRVNLDLSGLLRGTPMESWTAPENEEFLREVIRHARVLLHEGKVNTYFFPDEEIK